jgi:hypothetical protein
VVHLSGKPVELGPGSAQGAGISVECGSGCPMPSCDPAGTEGQGSQGSMDLVNPCRSGVQQCLRGRSRGVGILEGCGSGAAQKAGVLAEHGSGMGLELGMA